MVGSSTIAVVKVSSGGGRLAYASEMVPAASIRGVEAKVIDEERNWALQSRPDVMFSSTAWPSRATRGLSDRRVEINYGIETAITGW
jgi:hypothetical protein